MCRRNEQNMTIRERIEQIEADTLSPYACLSINSKGRDREEPQCDIRPVFQRAVTVSCTVSLSGD